MVGSGDRGWTGTSGRLGEQRRLTARTSNAVVGRPAKAGDGPPAGLSSACRPLLILVSIDRSPGPCQLHVVLVPSLAPNHPKKPGIYNM